MPIGMKLTRHTPSTVGSSPLRLSLGRISQQGGPGSQRRQRSSTVWRDQPGDRPSQWLPRLQLR
jgi:hypothetical protein